MRNEDFRKCKPTLLNALQSAFVCKLENVKILAAIFIMFLLSALAFSEDFLASEQNNEQNSEQKVFFIAIEPVFGVKIGQIDEYVFLNDCVYDDDKLSELNWEIKPEYYLGAKLSGEIHNIFVETLVTAAIPSKTGKMFDSDWFNIQCENQEDKLYKTNYSESDNYLACDFSFDLKIGYDFHFAENNSVQFALKPFAAFKCTNFKFNGKYGTAWYGNGVKNPTTNEYEYYEAYNDEEKRTITQFSGKVISYERWSYITWLGFDASADFGKHFSVLAGFKVSPYLYSESLDNHHLTSTDFLDKTPGFFKAFGWNLGFAYNINEHNALLLNSEYFFMNIIRGDNYSKSSSAKTYTTSSNVDGGAAERYLNVSVSYRLGI